MLSVIQMLKIDPTLARYSEKELLTLRETLYSMAQLHFDAWWAQKQGSKNPRGLFPDLGAEAKLRICKKKR